MAKRAEQFVLPALFFVSFFWAGKRKKGREDLHDDGSNWGPAFGRL